MIIKLINRFIGNRWTIIKRADFNICKTNYYKLVESVQTKNQTIWNQEKALEKIKKGEKLEEYWNNKRKKVNKQWKARDGINMDVRCFFQRNCTLPRFVGTHDNIAKNVLSWGIRNIQYIGDNGEFWQYAYETYLSRTGDCEDGAILMANILINSGVPYWRIRLNMGKVKGGYHAWLTYLKEDNEWYVMDWCYWAKESDGLKLKWKDAENYFTTDASWNCKYSFGGLSK